MCGRYTLTARKHTIAEAMNLGELFDWAPRYNIAPTQLVPVVRRNKESGVRAWGLIRWGLVPSWANDAAIGNRMINARAETVMEKPTFRAAFKSRRCLLPADGFYEWKRFKDRNQPFYFRLVHGRPFALAGLWESWQHGDEPPLETCAIVTTEANDLLRPIHERMPVIVDAPDYDRWLNPDWNPAELRGLLRPFPPDRMTAAPVSTRVNNPRHEGPECIAAISIG